jgi:hypothetical protein
MEVGMYVDGNVCPQKTRVDPTPDKKTVRLTVEKEKTNAMPLKYAKNAQLRPQD